MGAGNGSFAAPTDYPTPNLPTSVVLGDLDSDGILDTCAATQTGRVECWGDHAWGQLGVGEELPFRPSPSPTDLLTNVRSVGAGFSHTCALMSSGGPTSSSRYCGMMPCGEGRALPVDPLCMSRQHLLHDRLWLRRQRGLHRRHGRDLQ